MRPFPEIHTGRLRLTPVQGGDTEALFRHWTHPEVRRFLWDERIVSIDEVVQLVRDSQSQFQEQGHGLWVARGPETSELVGVGGYAYFWEPPELELMLSIVPEHWGRGMATEIGTALVRYGFEELSFPRVHASVDVGNEASIRVIEKLGMQLERRAVIEGLDTLFYLLERSRWHAHSEPGD